MGVVADGWVGAQNRLSDFLLRSSADLCLCAPLSVAYLTFKTTLPFPLVFSLSNTPLTDTCQVVLGVALL